MDKDETCVTDDTTFASMASTSSATMIGFSATIITLIIAFVENPSKIPNISFVLLFYRTRFGMDWE